MLNIINPDDVNIYLSRFCSDDERLQRFLIAALGNVIKQRESCMELLHSLPDDAPQWLRDKWQGGENWCRFNDKKDIKLAGLIFYIVGWLEDAILNDMAWTHEVDAQGRPYKLLQLSSFNHADRVMNKDLRQIADKKRKVAERAFLKDDLTHDFEKVMAFDNGFYIVKLKTEKALKLEGAYLEHCIGDGEYNAWLDSHDVHFYSLRDRNNLPCVSMCVEKDRYQMTQVRGRRNAYPKGKFIAYIATFCDQICVNLSSALSFHEGFDLLCDDIK
jgi:hypothetical protein